MTRMTTASALALLLVCGGAHAQMPKWTPISYSISKKSPGGLDDNILSPQHTSVVVRLELPDSIVIGADLTKSNVAIFSDDKNTNLLKQDKKSPFGASNSVSQNGQSLSITFHSPDLPGRGATKLRIKASIAVDIATTEKTVEMKNVSLSKGVDLGFGILQTPKPLTFLAKDTFGRNTVTFRGEKPIKSLVLFDEAGKETSFQNVIRGSSRAKNSSPYVVSFSFGFGQRASLPVDMCNIRVTYYDKVERRMLPLDMEIGFGF